MACKIGAENDDTNDFTERGGERVEDSLAYHLSNETEDVSRARFSLSLFQKMEMREKSVGAAKKSKCGVSEKR